LNNSLAALRSINTRALQSRVLAYIDSCGFYGATTDETEEALDLAHQTVSPRVLELRMAGMIEKAGSKRPTRSGRLADVYVTAKKGSLAAA